MSLPVSTAMVAVSLKQRRLAHQVVAVAACDTDDNCFASLGLVIVDDIKAELNEAQAS